MPNFLCYRNVKIGQHRIELGFCVIEKKESLLMNTKRLTHHYMILYNISLILLSLFHVLPTYRLSTESIFLSLGVNVIFLKIVKLKPSHYKAWTGPEVSRRLRFPDFVTTVRDDSKVVSHTHRPPLPPGNILGIHFC